MKTEDVNESACTPKNDDPLNAFPLFFPWERTTDPLEAQLYREVTPGHPLFGITARAVARRSDNKDTLFALSGACLPYAVVRLCEYAEASAAPLSPATEFYSSLDDWLENRMQRDREDTLHSF
jgi:hypothetical protein